MAWHVYKNLINRFERAIKTFNIVKHDNNCKYYLLDIKPNMVCRYNRITI